MSRSRTNKLFGSLIILVLLSLSVTIIFITSYKQIDNDNLTINQTTTHFNKINISTISSISISRRLPLLWVFGPAKTSTTSLHKSFTINYNYYRHPLNTPGEFPEIWMGNEKYLFAKSFYVHDKYIKFINILDNINNNSMIDMDNYPFYPIFDTIFAPNINNVISIKINNTLDLFTDILYNKSLIGVCKTPQYFNSPFVSLLFGYSMKYTNILIILRNPVKRLISYYSQFYTNKIMKYYSNDTYNIIKHHFNISLKYLPLNKLHQLIIDNNNNANDVVIASAFLKFYYDFGIQFVHCYRKHNTKVLNSSYCADININIDTQSVYQYIEYFRHPIMIILSNLYYPHLLILIYIYKQQLLLKQNMFKIILHKYLINNINESLYLIRCWIEQNVFKLNQLDLCTIKQHKNIYFPHVSSATKPFPNDISEILKLYFKPIELKLNHLLNQHQNVLLGGQWNMNKLW